jgi:lysophospholipase L1-like esterase
MTRPSSSPSPHRRRLVRVALVLGGILLPLVALEVGLRVTGFEFHLYPERLEFGFPDPKVLGRYFVAHDRYLWAQSDYDERIERVRASAPHVVLMGCSCTEWGKIDEGLVAASAEDPVPLRVANLGCSGWSSYQGLLQMKSDVVALAPDVVTIFYGWNDHWVGFGIEDKEAATYSGSAMYQLQKLRIVQFATKRAIGMRAEDDRIGERERPERVSLADFEQNLEAMVDLARANGIAPVLITAPTTHEAGKEPAYLTERHLNRLSDLVPLHTSYVDAVRKVARERDVPLCDLVAAFDALPREEVASYIKEDGIHFTPEGGAKIGALLHALFAEHGLLPVEGAQ